MSFIHIKEQVFSLFVAKILLIDVFIDLIAENFKFNEVILRAWNKFSHHVFLFGFFFVRYSPKKVFLCYGMVLIDYCQKFSNKHYNEWTEC